MGKAEKQAAWETKETERKAKEGEFEARRLAWNRRVGNLGVKSEHDDDMVSTAASSVLAVDGEEEVKRMVSQDKEVRKLLKVLREIQKLESQSELDALQQAKVARKHDVEVQLITAEGLAKARARNYLLRNQ